MSLLSILICHTPDRQDFLRRLNAVLDPQLNKHVKVFIDDSRFKSKGKKRNDMLARADGEYLCFVDDDDLVSKDYINLLLTGIKNNMDCCSLKGVITEDGMNPLVFEHSVKYSAYKTNTGDQPIRYERFPNHLNCVRASIAKQIGFPESSHAHGDANHGEDTWYAHELFKSGLIKTEHYIPEVLYYYEYRSRK